MMKNGEKREANREKYLPEFLLRRKGYYCCELLGQGAFATVYTVEEQSTGRRYACKVSRKPELLKREAQISAKLYHTVFPVYADFWEEAEFGFFLREYVEGSSMEDALRVQGAFMVHQVVQIGIELAEGLHYLHCRPEPYLFRDVKPANIIICQDGRVKLIDLGCVCAIEEAADAYAGTPGFAAPEQFGGDGVLTPACDIYALGQTLKAALQNQESTGEAFGYREKGRGKEALRRQENVPADFEHRKEGWKDILKKLENTVEDHGQQKDGRWEKILKKPENPAADFKHQEQGSWKEVLQKREANLREKKNRKKLMAVLDACTCKEPSHRIADMESLRTELSCIFL